MKQKDTNELERAFLGSVINSEHILDSSPVEAGHFANEEHRRIFEAILELRGEEVKVNILTLSQKLPDKDKLHAYIADLPTHGDLNNAWWYAQELKEEARQRALQENIKGYQESGNKEFLKNINRLEFGGKREEKGNIVSFDATEVPAKSKKEYDSLPCSAAGDQQLFRQGLSHAFSAYPKTGKSTFLCHACDEWANMGVAYISEEPQEIWHERRQNNMINSPGVQVYLAFGHQQKELLDIIETCKKPIVIIDTIRMLMMEDENNATEMNRTLSPLIRAARENKRTLILVHHTTKMERTVPGMATAGSHAFIGLVDVVAEMKRVTTEDMMMNNKRQIDVISRLYTSQIIYEKTGEGLVYVGDPQWNTQRAITDEVYNLLDEEWRSTTDIIKAIKSSAHRITITKSLNYLAGKYDNIQRDPDIKEKATVGKTLKWRKVSKEEEEQINIDDTINLFTEGGE